MSDLSHIDADGAARMVDVSAKPATPRMARATGAIRMQPETLDAILRHDIKKGDVISVARIAGIMAAKRTSDLVPLCHPLALTDIDVSLEADSSLPGLRAQATVRTIGPTGVEMEALTAVTVTLITVYDMAKAMDKAMEIGQVVLAEKIGGKSGHYLRG